MFEKAQVRMKLHETYVRCFVRFGASAFVIITILLHSCVVYSLSLSICQVTCGLVT